MHYLPLTIREALPTDVFTDAEVIGLLKGTPDRRHGLMKRALAKQDIIRLRRGVYSLGKGFQRQPPNPLAIAPRIYSPSYVSTESALSYHGWIPEAVYTVTSVCLKRSVTFNTPVGRFSYTRLPKFNFAGVERVSTGPSVFLIANPTKALADYILCRKTDLSPEQLRESLRVDGDVWRGISTELLEDLVESYPCKRLKAFLKALRKGGAR